MRQQVANGDVSLAVTLEPGHECRDAIVQTHFALLDEHGHPGRRGNDLGERCHVEYGVQRHGFGRGLDRALTDGAMIEDTRTAADEHYRTRQFLLIDLLSYERIQCLKLG